jgi:hypothetical protein
LMILRAHFPALSRHTDICIFKMQRHRQWLR